ncbi:SufE family protein [Hyphomicrobium sp. 1Nfss2.1]|uniref:SufE family protein n=1 Tax=Hyphomicrobium sp. 1Nfss2.1 TaxID=3413936 RepID=UPI003C7A1F99
MPTLSDITSDFAVLDDWEDRYRYLIELGRSLPPLPEELRTDANKVRGCASQVWLATDSKTVDGKRVFTFVADSDAHIVRGLVAILHAVYEGRPLEEAITLDPDPIFARFGLREHLTPQRSNGLASMVARVRADAMAMNAQNASAD